MKMTKLAHGGTLLVLLAFSARAQTPAEIDGLYADGEFATAVKKADAAIAKSKSAADVAKLQLTRGLSLLALGKSDKAKAAFTAALKKDAASKLDETRVTPEALALFDDARAELLVTVKIEVTGGEASVRIDGTPSGPAPLTMKLPVGAHVFEAKSADAREAKAEQLLAYGAEVTVTMTLPAPPPPPPEPQATLTAPPVETAATSAPVGTPAPAKEVVTSVTPATPKRTFWGLIPIGIGVLAGIGATIFHIVALNVHRSLTGGYSSESILAAEDYANQGKTFQATAWILTGTGSAAIIAGIIMLALPPASAKAPAVSVFASPTGGGVTVSGSLP